MTGLRELFQEAADSSSPPSRLVADEVYTAGRRWRRRRLTVATCTSAAVLATIAMMAASLLAPTGPSVDKPPFAGQTDPARVVDPWKGQRIQWAGAADAEHLYLAISTCTRTPCQKWLVQVTGSADGGRTWSEPGPPVHRTGLTVLGPDTLIAGRPSNQPGAVPTSAVISTDRGRTWTAAQPGQALTAVPEGSTAICWPNEATSCTVQVVDPGSHRMAPLAQQPPLIVNDAQITRSAGRLWVGGTDPKTNRPAVSVSADAGRTWNTRVFTDAPPCPPRGCAPPSLAVGNGTTVYAVVTGEGDRAVYRRTERAGKADWHRITGADHIPYEHTLHGSFLTADGIHVFHQMEDGADGADIWRFWAARDGGAYRSVELDGLPANAGPVRRTPDGWFYAIGADGVLHGSVDGWHWSPVTSR